MKVMKDLIDGRCGWCKSDDIYINYHDNEWGKLVTDDKTLFEFLILEGAQAGLSWLTILRRREGYRQAFHNFDVAKVAQMTDEDIERLMKFDGIIKNRLKITSAINNARLFITIQEEFGSFYNYTASFFPKKRPIVNQFKSLSEIPATSPESDAMSKDMISVMLIYKQPDLLTTTLWVVLSRSNSKYSLYNYHNEIKLL